MGGGREQQEVARQTGELLPQPIALGVAYFAAKEGRGQLVRLSAHNQVPVGLDELCLHRVIAAQLVETRNHQVMIQVPVATAGRRELLRGRPGGYGALPRPDGRALHVVRHAHVHFRLELSHTTYESNLRQDTTYHARMAGEACAPVAVWRRGAGSRHVARGCLRAMAVASGIW